MPALQTTTRSPGDATLLASEDDRPLLVTGRRGAGNIVQWYLAPCLWHSAYFGFGHGIDGLLWRGIPWAGPQPFYLHCMPPYVRYRLDDCHGHWRTPHDLSFLPPLARRGHCTSVCFCLRAIEPSAAAVLAHAQSNGTAELAPHTLAPGTSLFFGDDAGEYDDATLNRIFDELDDTATKWNVQWSSILSDHDHEWSRRAVPLLRARGITRKMNITLPGERWSGAHVDWRPAPYGSMSYALGALPGELGDFFAVFNHLPSAFDSARVPHPPTHFAYHRPGGFGAQKWDFLNGLVNGLSVDLAGAAERIDLHTRTGLDAMFFGGSISHSHFARHLTEPAWNDLLERADRATADIETVPTAYERIADYAQAHATSELVAAVRDDTTARLQLRGRSSTPLELSAFTTNEGAWQRRTIHVPPFEGGIEVTDRYL